MVLQLTDNVTAYVTETCNKQLEVLTELMVLQLTDNVTAYVTEICNKQTQIVLKVRVQRSGIDTIKYHTRPRIPMGK